MCRFAQHNDGSDPMDRQITMLEALSHQVDDISADVSTLQRSHQRSVNVLRRQSSQGPATLAAAAGNSSTAPAWAEPLQQLLAETVERSKRLSSDLDGLQKSLADHVESTNSQIAALEEQTMARLQRLETNMANLQPDSSNHP